jgi:hypothetical protein
VRLIPPVPGPGRALLLAALAAACTTQPSGPPGSPCEGLPTQVTLVERTAARELTIDGGPRPALGIFDPSIIFPSGGATGAMAYSAVNTSADIATRIAVSTDRGASWSDVGPANASAPTTVTVPPTSTRCPGGTCTGSLIHEVASLIEDPSDPDVTRRWKVFTHSYLVLGPDDFARDLGYLGLFTAPGPAGPWNDEGKALGWTGESAFSSDGAYTLVTAIPALADCVALTEPGALVHADGGLDLAVACASATSPTDIHIRIELLRSTDHARTFVHVARLLGDADALALGSDGPQLNAADLFLAGGRTYLSVSPGGPNALGFDGYRGCAILELTSAGDAVERSDAGTPRVCRTLDGPGTPFAGACTYAEGASAIGYLLPQLSLEGPPPFRIFTSGVPAP